MRIGINLLYLIPGMVGGTQTYALGLVEGLARSDGDNEYLLYLNRECTNLTLPKSPSFKPIYCPLRANNRGVRYAYEQAVLPRRARLDKLDLIHSLGYVGPVRTPCPHVLTIHDMNYLDIPQSVPGLRQKVLSTLVRRAAARADRVITISEFSRQRIIAHLHLPGEKVVVTHLAAREPDPHRGSSDVPGRYGITRPYVIAFSSPFPHKNIPRLIQAFARIAGQVDHALVLVGHLPDDGEVAEAVRQAGLGERVLFTGYVPDADVMPLIGQADLFAFPSIYEGFGLPLLDAQRMGVPVVASTAASIPEVAGEGASYFDPADVQAMATVLVRVLREPAVAQDLTARGAANVKKFTWDATARKTASLYRAVIAERAAGRPQ